MKKLALWWTPLVLSNIFRKLGASDRDLVLRVLKCSLGFLLQYKDLRAWPCKARASVSVCATNQSGDTPPTTETS